MKKIVDRGRAVIQVVGELAWRGVGVFFFILGGSAGAGAVITSSWINGVLIAWVTLMLGVVSAVGYAIAVTGKATREDVAKATQDAVQKAQTDLENNKNK